MMISEDLPEHRIINHCTPTTDNSNVHTRRTWTFTSTAAPRWASPSPLVLTDTESLAHQHLRAGLRQNNNNFVGVLSAFFDRDIDRSAARLARLAKLAMRSLSRRLTEASDLTGVNEGDSGGVGDAVDNRTNSNSCTTQRSGAMALLPHSSERVKPEVQSMSKRCCSAAPNFWGTVGGTSGS